MQVGDLVRFVERSRSNEDSVGVVLEIIQKKVWRAYDRGRAVNWDLVEPEPHAVILLDNSNKTMSIPTVDLEIVSES